MLSCNETTSECTESESSEQFFECNESLASAASLERDPVSAVDTLQPTLKFIDNPEICKNVPLDPQIVETIQPALNFIDNVPESSKSLPLDPRNVEILQPKLTFADNTPEMFKSVPLNPRSTVETLQPTLKFLDTTPEIGKTMPLEPRSVAERNPNVKIDNDLTRVAFKRSSSVPKGTFF